MKNEIVCLRRRCMYCITFFRWLHLFSFSLNGMKLQQHQIQYFHIQAKNIHYIWIFKMNFNIKKINNTHTHFYWAVDSHKRSGFFNYLLYDAAAASPVASNHPKSSQSHWSTSTYIMKRTRTSCQSLCLWDWYEPVFFTGIFCKWAADSNSDKN